MLRIDDDGEEGGTDRLITKSECDMSQRHQTTVLKKGTEKSAKCPHCGFFLPRVFHIFESSYKVTVPPGDGRLVYVDPRGVGWERASFVCGNCHMTLHLKNGKLLATTTDMDF